LAAWTIPDEQAVTSNPLAPSSSTPTVSLARAVPMSGFLVAPAISGAILLIVWLATTAGSLGPRPIPPSVRRAGLDFVTVFARPLVDESSGVPPIRMRLKFRRRTQQLEISLAPGPGRRYPNLEDHKKNVEYDVDRVMRALGDQYVLADPLRSAGEWVVVTISQKSEVTSQK
jgi:hypothetical protein